MNLRKSFERHTIGRLIHRVLVTFLLVCLVDMNEQTVFGLPAVWVQSALAERPDGAQSLTSPPGTGERAPGRVSDPAVSWALGTLTGTWNLGFPYLAASGQRWEPSPGMGKSAAGVGRALRLAQAPPNGGGGGSPDVQACFGLLARAKGGKVQLVWAQVAGTTTYEVYRGLDGDAVSFVMVGTVAGNSEAFLDSPLGTDTTYLYFIRAVGAGLACDSQVAAAHATNQRGTRNYPPVIYSVPPGSAEDGELVSYRVRAVDPNPGDIVLYDLAEGPLGMDVDPVTGELSWASVEGAHPVQVMAVDGIGATDVQAFTLVVSPREVQVPEVVGLTETEAGSAITGAGLVVGAVSLAFDESVPEGLVVQQDPVGGTSVVSGTAVDLVISAGPAPVEVPNVVGLAQAAAEAAMVAAGLSVGAITTANDPAVPAGNVISQNPVGGTSVAPGSAVALVISTGPAPVEVPNVVGLTQAAAEAAMVAAGLSVGAITTANDPVVPAGNVISQNPVGGTSVAPGSAVALVISTGPAPVSVPNVVGLAQAAAEAAIGAAGLSVGAITTANDPAVPAGNVISQNPVGGTSVAPGSAVALVISTGPAPVSVPNVVGLAQAAAEAAIGAAGLSVGAITTANDPAVPAGNVISQNPVGGTSVAPGSAVALVISTGPASVEVPNVVGLTQAAAEAAIGAAGLSVGAITTANDPAVPAGNVISQNPVGGTSVAPGSAVALVISTGPAPVSVPNVVGLAQAAAEAAIGAAGLSVGAITTANDPAVPAGSVISQNPVGGTSVAPGSAVALVISTGPAPVSVPNVVGLAQAAAEAAIGAAGLSVGAITTANDPAVPAGSVISQNPVGGTSVAPGSAVALVISTGPAPVSVPNVVGLAQAAAEAAIGAAGLSVGAITTANDPAVPAGNVISQNPVGGTSVAPGSAVALVISTGPAPVEVPNVVGLAQAAAEAAIGSAGLSVGAITTANDPAVPAGSVISQNPVGGTSVAPGSAVALVISTGPAPVSVPNVVGLAQAAAEAAIGAAGLSVGAITTANDPAVPAGNVISQNPVGGTSVAPGSAVALVISTGPAPVSVPNVVGLAQAAAEAAIGGAGLSVGAITTANDPAVPAGNVISQNPVGGTSVAPGSAVALVISTGPAPVEVPDVVGLAQVDAETAITEADLTVGDVTLMHDAAVPDGVVISQDPVGGTSVAPGSAVDLVVSLGPEPVSVPNVVGLTQAAAEAAIGVAGLSVGAITTANDPAVPAGSVISQNPVGGTSVAPGSAVALVISLGPVMVSVPDVVGQTQAAASSAITSAGLSIGTITTVNHPNAPAGTVISQNPVGGTSVVPGSAVALTVSLGSGAPVLTTIEVGPADQSLAAGETQQYVAIGTWSDGHNEDITATVSWVSTQVALASITAGGLATALDPGVTTIQASRDGITGGTTLTIEAPALVSIQVTPVEPVILVGQTQDFSATGILTDGTSRNLDDQVTWGSTDLAVAGINAAGIAVGASGGSTDITATLGAVVGSTPLTVHATVADATAPTVAITAPANNATVTSPATVTGTANDANFLKYVLDYALAGETTFTTLAEGDAPVVNGALGTFDPTVLLNDLYTVRLTVFDKGGNSTSTTRTYQVARDQKVGNFSLTFDDLTLPLAGIPITISRLYDSRDKGQGDFGIGWRLDIQTMKARANRNQGTGWQVNKSGGFIPTYNLVGTDEHKVSITLPDGKIEEFDLRPNPSSSTLFPLDFLTAAYAPRSGTLGTLVPLGSTDLFIFESQPGPVTLVDFNSFDTYNPTSFQYTAVDGRVYVISKTGGVQSIREPNGNTLSIGAGGITHSSGASVVFQRDGFGRITAITDPSGTTQRYDYDSNGDLASHTDVLNNRSRYFYNLSHGLLEIRDPRGFRPIRNEYDDSGRITAHVDAEGDRIEYTHQTGANQEIVRDRLGRTTVFNYDANGYVLSRTDPLGNTTSYTYDARGNRLTETDALGNTVTMTYDGQDNILSRTDALGHQTRFTYNARGQVLTSTDPEGGVTTHAYDAQGNILSIRDPSGMVLNHTYDAAGNRTSTTDALGNVTRYEYDGAGNNVREIDALGNVITYTYDARGNRLTETRNRTGGSGVVHVLTTRHSYDLKNRRIGTIYPDGSQVSIEYDAVGNKTAEVDERGFRTDYRYDSRNNLVETVHPDGTLSQQSHDAEGNLVAEIDRSGRVTTRQYDGANRLTVTIHPDETTVENIYDDAGRRIAVVNERGARTSYEYDDGGRNTAVIDALGNRTTYEYDGLGRKTAMIDALGHRTEYEYDAAGRETRVLYEDGTSIVTSYDAAGRRVTKTDQAGLTTRFAYDALYRMTRVIDPMGEITEYGYDELGNRLRQTDANGRVTSMEYDHRGRMVSRTLPLGMTERMSYDTAGNLVSRTDFNGATTTYEFDTNKREIRRVPAGGNEIRTTFSPTGQRTSVTSDRGVTLYSYDLRDRLLSVLEPQGAIVRYAYDESGNRIQLGAPGGDTGYEYDELNRLVRVTSSDGGVTTYSYDAVGRRSGMGNANGTTALYEYDSLNRLVRLANRRPNGSLINQFDYTLLPTGHRAQVVEDTGRSVAYSYDGNHRLIGEHTLDPGGGDRTVTYTYDAVGNRLTKSDEGVLTEYQYDANDRLIDETGKTYSYDLNGSLVSVALSGGGVTFYEYDSEGRLVEATGDGRAASYAYDEDGLRVRAELDGVETRYLLDKNLRHAQVIEERSSAGALIVRYEHGDDLIRQVRLGVASVYHYDGLGSTRALTAADGVMSDSYRFDAFGRLLFSSGLTENRYLFAGEQLDAGTGFYYLRARYYDPGIGRFTTVDSYPGDPQAPLSLHKYLYAHADPINNVDPGGMFSLVQIAVVSAIVGILAGLVTYAITGSVEKAIYVGLLAALITAAVMTVWTFWPAISRAFATWFRQQAADRTVSNQLYQKLLQKYGPNPTQADKLQFFKGYSEVRLWLSGIRGYGQKLLELFTNPAGFIKWFQPTVFDGVVGGALVVAAMLAWAYRDDIAALFEDLGRDD